MFEAPAVSRRKKRFPATVLRSLIAHLPLARDTTRINDAGKGREERGRGKEEKENEVTGISNLSRNFDRYRFPRSTCSLAPPTILIFGGQKKMLQIRSRAFFALSILIYIRSHDPRDTWSSAHCSGN